MSYQADPKPLITPIHIRSTRLRIHTLNLPPSSMWEITWKEQAILQYWRIDINQTDCSVSCEFCCIAAWQLMYTTMGSISRCFLIASIDFIQALLFCFEREILHGTQKMIIQSSLSLSLTPSLHGLSIKLLIRWELIYWWYKSNGRSVTSFLRWRDTGL